MLVVGKERIFGTVWVCENPQAQLYTPHVQHNVPNSFLEKHVCSAGNSATLIPTAAILPSIAWNIFLKLHVHRMKVTPTHLHAVVPIDGHL